MIKRFACLAILCALSAQAAAQEPFDWSTAVLYDLRGSVPVDASGRLARDVERDALPEGGALLVDPDELSHDQLAVMAAQAAKGGLHLVLSIADGVDPAQLPEPAADGILLDGDANDHPAFVESATGRRLPVASTDPDASGVQAVALDAPSELLAPVVDWEATFSSLSDTRPPRVVLLPAKDLPPERLRQLLFLPAGVLMDDLPKDAVVREVIAFRLRHPAVGAGRHERLVNNHYTFWRSLERSGRRDDAIIVFGAGGMTTVNVSRAFADDTLLQDALTGRAALVSFGMVRFEAHESGLILIEAAP